MQDLIKVVYKTPELKCLDGRNVSYALSTNLKTIIDKSLEVHEKGVNKAYTLNIYYRDSESERPDKEILFFKEGVFSNCSSIPGGWKHINKDSGIINIELEVCRG